MHDDVRKVIKNLEFSQKPDIKPYFLHIYRIYLPPVKQKETDHRDIENFSPWPKPFLLSRHGHTPRLFNPMARRLTTVQEIPKSK